MRGGEAGDLHRLRRTGEPEQFSACARVKCPRNKARHDGCSSPCRGHKKSPPFSWSRCRGPYAHCVSANRLGDILDAMAAKRAAIEIELVPDLLVDRLRNADGTRLGERLEPGSDVDAIAENVVAVDDDVAEIDPDPQLETALSGDRVVDRTRRSLHLDRAV